MNTDYFLVEGPKRKEISLVEDLDISPEDAHGWFHYLHKQLKPHLIQIGHNFAYLMTLKKGIIFDRTRVFPITKKINEDFLEEYIFSKGRMANANSSTHVYVIKIELRNDQLFCTPVYVKSRSDMQKQWASRGIFVLEP